MADEQPKPTNESALADASLVSAVALADASATSTSNAAEADDRFISGVERSSATLGSELVDSSADDLSTSGVKWSSLAASAKDVSTNDEAVALGSTPSATVPTCSDSDATATQASVAEAQSAGATAVDASASADADGSATQAKAEAAGSGAAAQADAGNSRYGVAEQSTQTFAPQATLAPHTPPDLAERVDVLTAGEEDPEIAEAMSQLELRRAARRRKRIIKFSIAGVVVLVAAFILLKPLLFPDPQQDNVQFPELAYAQRSTFETTVTASGMLKPNSAVSVTPEVEGIIESLAVAQDQQVNAGDLLFTIKNDKLDRAVAEAEQGIAAAQRELNQASAGVTKAINAYYKAYDDYWAAYEAWQLDPELNPKPTEPDQEALQDAIDVANAGVDTANTSLDNARASLSDAQVQADKRQVRAPTSGAVVSLKVEEGAAASLSTAALQIADLSRMRVTVQINEVDISSIKVGQTAEVTFSAMQDLVLEATVERIASVATGMENLTDAAGAGGVVSFAVDLVIPNPDPRLKPGMTANVTIRTEHVEDALVVPVACVTTDDEGKSWVEVVKNEQELTEALMAASELDDPSKAKFPDSVTERVEVQVGPRSSSEVVIAGGLEDGTCVLASPSGGGDDLAGLGLSDEETATLTAAAG